MYKALIVDDEPLMLKYLTSNLEKLDSRWKIYETAQDGCQAIKLIDKESYDLVITDIRMPIIDGLAVAQHIKQKGLSTKVILISGYDDFEYARQAVRCGVYDYLSKPLVDKELIIALNNVVNRIRDEELQKLTMLTFNSLAKKSLNEVKATFLYSIIHEEISKIHALYPVLCKMGVTFIDGYGAILLIRPNIIEISKQKVSEEQVLLYQIMLRELCSELSFADAIYFQDIFGNLAFLLSSEAEDDILTMAHDIKAFVEQLYIDRMKAPLVASLGEIVNDMFSLADSYYSAMDGFICGDEDAYIYTINRDCRSLLYNIKNNCGNILYSLLVRNDTELFMNIGKLLDCFTKPYSYIECITSVFGFINPSSVHNSTISSNFEMAFYRLSYILANKVEFNELELESAYAIFLRRLRGESENDSIISNTSNALAQKVKQYICTHYNEPLSLSILADKFSVTSAYLSDVFHKQIGESYSKFLSRIRMEQAARILQSEPDTKIFEIAEQVGFISIKHFNVVFKKHYSMSPKEYRRSL